MKSLTLLALYHKLHQLMGPQHWPADSKLEIAIGAILVQNTAWPNVEPAIANLKQATGFEVSQLAALTNTQLEPLIRSSGFYKNKSQTILNWLAWLHQYNDSLTQASKQPQAKLRSELLALKGIGFETADVILLFTLKKAVFIADTYAQRLFQNLGVAGVKDYKSLQAIVAKTDLKLTLPQWQLFHGCIDTFGKTYLRRNQNFADSPLFGYQLVDSPNSWAN